jgi:hypothetical protein
MPARKTASNKTASKKKPNKLWSGPVTRNSNALDLEPGVFRMETPRQVAESLKRSALASNRRKAQPFQSAMSMLNFYINRAGKNLSAERKKVLEQAKTDLRAIFAEQKPSSH